MKRLGLLAYGAGVAGTILFAAPFAIDAVRFHARPEVDIVQLWSLWLASSLGPLALSATAWTTAQKFRPRWLPHLTLIPVAMIFYTQSMSLFLRVSGLAIHDGPAGDASAPGGLLLLLTLIVHVSALAMAAGKSLKRQTEDDS